MFIANRSTFHFMHHFAMPPQLNLQDTGTEAQNSAIKSYFLKKTVYTELIIFYRNWVNI